MSSRRYISTPLDISLGINFTSVDDIYEHDFEFKNEDSDIYVASVEVTAGMECSTTGS